MPDEVAGVISRITLENFMCHSSLSTELIDNVNFITGQNGSGKSAILTALCVAFGIRARGTQRATSLKQFIKNGCNSATVVVEMKNEGPEAFKPDIYGKRIYIERKINTTATTIVLKDQSGRKVSSKKDELLDIIDHYNIDVENPCVIMSQDRSREFLSSGTDKEKFKFFYKASLLQQVAELLDANLKNIEACQAHLKANEATFRPYEEQLRKLDKDIRRAELVDEMEQQITNLRKRLAWSHIEKSKQAIQARETKLQQSQNSVAKCQQKIDTREAVLAEKKAKRSAMNDSISELMSRTQNVKETQGRLYKELKEVSGEKSALEETLRSKSRLLEAKRGKKRSLEQHAQEMQERFIQSTQAEENEREAEREAEIRSLQEEISRHRDELRRAQESEADLNSKVKSVFEELSNLKREMDDKRTSHRDLQAYIRRLQSQQSNKLLAFGGESVLRLMRSIENQHRSFTRPPLGPIGAHIALAGGNCWAVAVEAAVGKLLNAFIVSNHRDMLLLRNLARECNYGNLQIIIYDFEHPPLNMPQRMLPDQNLVTVLSVLQTENTTIRNVLIDQGSVERQVLVTDYDAGRDVVFERRQPNVKEAFTKIGQKMFARAGSQTTLPGGNIRSGRLEAGIDQRISQLEAELCQKNEELTCLDTRKRNAEDLYNQLNSQVDPAKKATWDCQCSITRLEKRRQYLERQAEQTAAPVTTNTDELDNEIKDVEAEACKLERGIEEIKAKLADVQARHQDAKSRYDHLCDSTKDDAEAVRKASENLQSLEDEENQAASDVKYYKEQMLHLISKKTDLEREIQDLQRAQEEQVRTATQICTEEELETIGGVNGTPEGLTSEMNRLKERLRHEQRDFIPPEKLQKMKMKLEKKIFKKKNVHMQLMEKVDTIWSLYTLRRTSFERTTAYLRRQLEWQFRSQLKKKGFSGKVKIDYEAKSLNLEVQMPQDASNKAVRDTRALSGGERSFSTLCFAIALHQMTEAPFRAMDEFDVFMDTISRKISMDAVVDFAIEQGSQWIFITPHDISSVKSHPKLKKQQMSAPRQNPAPSLLTH